LQTRAIGSRFSVTGNWVVDLVERSETERKTVLILVTFLTTMICGCRSYRAQRTVRKIVSISVTLLEAATPSFADG
jgi:hypothetical protein